MVPETLNGGGLLRKIALEIAGFRVVKPREKTETGLFHLSLDSTKSFTYFRGRQTRRFQTVGLTISSFGRNRANLRKSNIYHMNLSLSWPEGANVTNGTSHVGNGILRCYQRYSKGLFILHSYLHHLPPCCSRKRFRPRKKNCCHYHRR